MSRNKYLKYAAYFLIGMLWLCGAIGIICGAASTTIRGTIIYGATGIILSLSALGLSQLMIDLDR